MKKEGFRKAMMYTSAKCVFRLVSEEGEWEVRLYRFLIFMPKVPLKENLVSVNTDRNYFLTLL